MIPLLWVMLALTVATAVQRFVRVWQQANAAGQRPPPAARRAFVRREGYESPAMTTRWRAWREANGWEPRFGRYANGARRGSAASKWHDRRQARLERRRAGEGAGWRRSGSRRP
jgi:hypothetical protein